MLAQLRRSLPGVCAARGLAESLPFADSVLDGILASVPSGSSTSRQVGGLAVSVQRSPCALTGMTPAFISSESALQIPAEMIHYGMSKTALLAVSRGFAKEAAGSGVTVNCVPPGRILSEQILRNCPVPVLLVRGFD